MQVPYQAVGKQRDPMQAWSPPSLVEETDLTQELLTCSAWLEREGASQVQECDSGLGSWSLPTGAASGVSPRFRSLARQPAGASEGLKQQNDMIQPVSERSSGCRMENRHGSGAGGR